MFRAFQNLPVGLKASAASAMLLLCLVGLGTNALVVINGLGSGLINLTSRSLPKQKAILAISTEAINIHVNLFRYVAWVSSGVNRGTLKTLDATIVADSKAATLALSALEHEQHLSGAERAAVKDAIVKWTRYATSVSDTIDIATTDPALGTMMLGEADEDYKHVAARLDTIASLVTGETMEASRRLELAANHSKFVIAGGGALAVLLGFGVTVLVTRSLVKPIQAVTRAMRAISVGETGAEFGPTRREDEIGQMVNAIALFRDQIERDNQLLASREQDLLVQNTRFDAALNNMSQGLAMFDAQAGLIVCNARFAEIYRLPLELLKPGMTQREILQLQVAKGLYAGTDPDAYLQNRTRVAAAKRDCDLLLELNDGRTIAVSHRVMPGGGWVSTHENATERCKAEQHIAHMARHDALTDLPNRLYFREQIDQALALLDKDETLAIMCVDLDHFKAVNDTLGHSAGDALLVMVAERLRRCVRRTDTIARFGGDEFVVIQRSVTRLRDVVATARRIVASVSEPYDIDGRQALIGASVGVAVAADDSTSRDQLLRNADAALYQAKADGRQTYRFFKPGMDADRQERHLLEADLRKAQRQGELELYYQPIVDLRDNVVRGFEALLRWNHPERGIILPTEFIPLAEETGLIGEIGDWVLRQSCAQASTWSEPLYVAINLSPIQFRNGRLVYSLTEALAAYGLRPGRVELEITESIMLHDNPTTMTVLHQLRDIGVRISLDDLGAGYGSLDYLRRFPFDKIKIDRSFVQDVATRSDCAAIVRAMATLAGSLGMTATAEGVETGAQLEQVRAAGCTEGQGYLFGRPMPVAELTLQFAPAQVQLVA
ncbi:MAG: EAL domain-containing protein [Casimicrobiaceae bacterium]